MYIFDTNVLIYYLNNDKTVVSKIDEVLKTNSIIYFSVISEAEILSFKELKEDDFIKINNILNTLNVVNMDSRIARIAAFLRRNINIKIGDSIIAATALHTQSILVTRNISDFKNVPNLRLEKI